MTGVTNRGKRRFLEWPLNALALPTNFFAALFTAANSPTATTSTRSSLTEVAAGNGYTAGGISLSKNATDFPSITQDDTNNLAKILVRNLTWTASGGDLPADDVGARWMCLCSGTAGTDDIISYWDLGASRVVTNTQQLQVNAAEIDVVDS
jgi:hypothetical protein